MKNKNWIKRVDDKDMIEWYSTEDRYSYVRIWKIGLSSHERNIRGIGSWGLSARWGLMGNEVRNTFKSRKQALEYAKKVLGLKL